MKVEHRFTANGRCPVDGCLDEYEVVVVTDRVIRVEDILAASRAIEEGPPIMQEAYTQAMADALGCEVVTFGEHSGVETTCVCSSRAPTERLNGTAAGGTGTASASS